MRTWEIAAMYVAMVVMGLSVCASGEVKKGRVESLTPITESAEVIFAAPWARTRSKFGLPSNELYVADSRGRNVVRITHNRCHYNHFAVSPNRKMIAAVRYSSGDTNRNRKIDFRDRKTVWILDLANKQEWPLVPQYDAGWGGVDWSPDNQFVYFSMFKGFKSDIYRIRLDGTGLTNITKGIERALSPGLPNKWVSDTGVSPDGQWIVFLYSGREATKRSFKAPKKSRIAICRVDGTEPKFVTDGGSIKPLAHGPWGPGDFDPEFSPDGKHICFQRATDVAVISSARIPSHDVMRVNIDGTGLKTLSPKANPAMHGIADWSEDNRIIFTEWNAKDKYVGPIVVNADGSDYHRLTSLPRGGSHVRWIPAMRKRGTNPRGGSRLP